MNFSTNFTTAITGTVSSDGIAIPGQMSQAYNNLWTKSPLTGSTNRFSYDTSITGAGAGPFITAVGLYNNNNDLMAVAKLARPLKNPTALPITFKVIQNRNLYADLSFFLLEAIFIIVFGFLGLYFINKYLYDERIKKIQLFLDEIKNFKNEKESVANIS